MPRHPPKLPSQPITHMIIDTSSTNEFDDNDGRYCAVPMTVEYVTRLLGYMAEAGRLHQADEAVYSIECWDANATFFRFSDELEELRDVDGNLAVDIPPGEPILLTSAPNIGEADIQRVECQSVHFVREDVWWAAYVNHANNRIETAHVEKTTLLRILRSLGGVGQSCRHAKARPVPPAVRRIHDLLYLDTKGGRPRYIADRTWDADTMAAIAEVVAKYIPRPRST